MGSLAGKNAFITGTSQGIGAAISKELIERGCNVCMHYFHSVEQPELLKKLAEEKGQKAICVQADLTNPAEVSSCIQKAVDYFGQFDILVNNSGSLVERRMLEQVDMEFWNKLIDINLTSMMLVTKELTPYFNRVEGSSIVNLSSLAGRKGGHPGSLIYSMTKGAVLTFTRALSTELGPDGIRVNGVAPGFIEGTNFHKTHTSRESALKTIEGIPLGRSGNPEDVARAVAFLASEYDGFINGITLDINGGVYCA
ncbi:SDR family NAD(P)-dependent oxidoreductase [Mangrovibacterium sp.]|uniref:SDR family NAD(P)-dependent oxidoreductase n=1 Tax=Mangrovibacterium sp. TaxID=1961364 RepID=UPI003562E9EE